MNRIQKKLILSVKLFGLIYILQAKIFANDSEGGHVGGQVRFFKNDFIVIEKETLTIAPWFVEVDYLFRSYSEKTI